MSLGYLGERCHDVLVKRGHYEMKPTWNKKKLFVRNIDYKATHKDLCEFFECFGKVASLEILKDRKYHGRSRGMGFVIFEAEESADAVLKSSPEDLTFQSRVLHVELARRRKFVPEKVEDSSTAFPWEEESLPLNSSSHPEEPRVTHIHDLPDEVMLYLWSWLPLRNCLQAARVCKRWQFLSNKSWYLRKAIRLQGVSTTFGGLDDTVFVNLLKRCGPNLRKLDLFGCSGLLTDWSLGAIGKYCPQIQELFFSSSRFTDKGLQKMAKSCTQLQHISFSHCLNFGEDGLWWLFKSCGDLKSVNVEGNSRLSGQCFHMIGGHLERVNLSRCTHLRDVALEKLASKCLSTLTEIFLAECCSITDEGMIYLALKCKSLKTIDLRDCSSHVTSRSLRNLGTLPQLSSLCLQGITSVDDQVVKCISEGCPLLRCLNVQSCHSGLTDLGMESLSWLSYLEELNISYLHKVHDTGLQSLSKIQCLKKLMARGCGGITNEGVKSIVSSCQKLEHLDISGCLQVNESIVTPKALDGIRERYAEDQHKLTIVVGGTRFCHNPYPDFLILDFTDLCNVNLMPDLSTIFVHSLCDWESDSQDDEIEYEDYGNFGHCVDTLLDSDDPLAQEDFELS